MEQWYLSFDCATKTFAYVLVKIKLNHLFIDVRKVLNLVKILTKKIHCNFSDDMANILYDIDNKTKYAIEIITGNCIDLIPGIDNNNINTVDRIKIVSKYVKNDIFPFINDIPMDKITILIEFQMSYNTQSKIVSIALLTLFSEYTIHLVNPSLKNKIYFTEEGKYYHFIEKYKNSYDANKKHALYNFKEFERIFDQHIDVSDNLKGHIADSFMQIFGYIMFIKNK